MTSDCAPLHGEDNLLFNTFLSVSTISDAFPKSLNRGIECPMIMVFPIRFQIPLKCLICPLELYFLNCNVGVPPHD